MHAVAKRPVKQRASAFCAASNRRHRSLRLPAARPRAPVLPGVSAIPAPAARGQGFLQAKLFQPLPGLCRFTPGHKAEGKLTSDIGISVAAMKHKAKVETNTVGLISHFAPKPKLDFLRAGVLVWIEDIQLIIFEIEDETKCARFFCDLLD